MVVVKHKAIVTDTIETESNPYNSEDLKYRRGFDKRFPNVKARVLSILKNDDYARKNYLWLCLVYWCKMGHIKIVIPKENFGSVNSPETIVRASRKIMEEAKKGDPKLSFLLKGDDTLNLRNEREAEIHDYFTLENNKTKGKWIK